MSDKDRAFRSKLGNGLLRRHGIRRRYGAVRKKGSTGIIERFWRSMKNEYARHLFLYRSDKAIETRLERYRSWFNEHRPHQGSGNVRLTTCFSIDQQNRRATSLVACCRSGSSRQIVGCPYYACAAQRSSHPLTLSAGPEVCAHVGVGVSVQRHPSEERPESAGQR